MKFSESPIMIFVRSMVLLAVLIALPGIAVCWNHIPKDFWKSSDQEEAAPKQVEKKLTQEVPIEPAQYVSVPSPPEVLLPPEQLAVDMPTSPVQQVTFEQPSPGGVTDFKSLELRLKALGAKYYRLEKWGNRGELFRFSCFVTPSDRNQYEKYFQAIGANEVTIMESVISDIERWKNKSQDKSQERGLEPPVK